MWEKIKAFFKSKTTKIVEWILLGIIVIGMLIGGIKLDDINSGVLLWVGVADAVVLIAKFITDHCK